MRKNLATITGFGSVTLMIPMMILMSTAAHAEKAAPKAPPAPLMYDASAANPIPADCAKNSAYTAGFEAVKQGQKLTEGWGKIHFSAGGSGNGSDFQPRSEGACDGYPESSEAQAHLDHVCCLYGAASGKKVLDAWLAKISTQKPDKDKTTPEELCLHDINEGRAVARAACPNSKEGCPDYSIKYDSCFIFGFQDQLAHCNDAVLATPGINTDTQNSKPAASQTTTGAKPNPTAGQADW